MNRTIRLASVAVAATSVVALGATFRASASTTPGDAGAASKAAQAALRYVTANPPATNQAVPGARHGVRGLTQFYSTNWSGYANNNSGGNTYSNVSAHWTQPAITCPTNEEQLAAFWVGIDGYTSNTVEQAGTLAQCFEGTAHYYTWWEMYPTNDIQVVGNLVKPGDKITATVSRNGTKYTLKATDSTTSGNNVDTTQTCAAAMCANSSAEWIGEAPGGARGEYPLPNFGTWKVSSASVTSGTVKGNIKSFPDTSITMQGSALYALATPGALNTAGTAFADTWDNSY